MQQYVIFNVLKEYCIPKEEGSDLSLSTDIHKRYKNTYTMPDASVMNGVLGPVEFQMFYRIGHISYQFYTLLCNLRSYLSENFFPQVHLGLDNWSCTSCCLSRLNFRNVLKGYLSHVRDFLFTTLTPLI